MQSEHGTIVAKPMRGALRHVWKVALVILVALPFLPELAIYAASALAQHHDCKVDQKTACLIGSTAVHDILVTALHAELFIAASFFIGYVAAWLALCFIVVTLGWTNTFSRFLVAFAVTVLFALLPYFGPMLAIRHLVNANCADSCVIYGGDVGKAAQESGALPWLTFKGAPIAFGMFILYVVVALIIRGSSDKSKGATAA